MRPSYLFRVFVSCITAVCLCGASLGMRGIQDTQAAATVVQQEAAFRYNGFSREAYPKLLGPWLRMDKYNPFLSKASPAFPIPELAMGYVPQGMCYSQALGCFVLTYYHPDKRPSLLALINAESGMFVKSVYLLKPGGLPYTGHAGGTAAWGEHVWVTSEGRAWRFAAKDLREARDGGTVRFRDSFRPASRGGIAFTAEDMLWIGDSYSPEHSKSLPEDHLDPESGNYARCVGYPLSENAPMGVEGIHNATIGVVVPKVVLSIQNYAQGACVGTDGELMVSTSFSARAPSWLWVYPSLRGILEQPPKKEVTIEKHPVPLWVVDTGMVTNKQMLAPMSEGICEYNGAIYSSYESAALLYRERAEMYADHVFKIDERDILPPPYEQTSIEM